MKRLFIIQECFEIEGRGIILAPGIPVDEEPELFEGRALTIAPVDQSADLIQVEIKSLEFVLCEVTEDEYAIPVCLKDSIDPEAIPPGSAVYVAED